MPKLTEKKLKINIAMGTDDLIYVDELLVRPQAINNNELEYMNLLTLGYEFCDLNKVEIKNYED